MILPNSTVDEKIYLPKRTPSLKEVRLVVVGFQLSVRQDRNHGKASPFQNVQLCKKTVGVTCRPFLGTAISLTGNMCSYVKERRRDLPPFLGTAILTRSKLVEQAAYRSRHKNITMTKSDKSIIKAEKAQPAAASKKMKVKKEETVLVTCASALKHIAGKADDVMTKCINCTTNTSGSTCLFWEKENEYGAVETDMIDKMKGKVIQNRAIRWNVYRKFVRINHPGLQRGQRVRIPDCVVANIREFWPNAEGDEYVGFKEAYWYTADGKESKRLG